MKKVFFTILPIHIPFWVFLIDFYCFLLQFKAAVLVDVLANSVIFSEALKFTKIVEERRDIIIFKVDHFHVPCEA